MQPKFKADNYIIIVSLFFLLITLLPFIILSFYNAPLADDYIYAHQALDRGFLKSQSLWYFQWTGRYFATLLISANPLYLNWIAGNAVIPIVSMIAFSLSLLYFVRSFAVLKLSGSLQIFVLFVLLYLSNLHTISQAFYWMPGLHTYITGMILFLFLWGYFIRIYNRTGRVTFYNYGISFLVIVMLMGTSEIAIFYNNYIAFAVLVFCYFTKRNMFAFALFLFAVTLAFGLTSLLAPGNFIRQNYIGSEGGVNYFLQFKIMLDISLTRLLPAYIFNIPTILAMLFIAFFSSQEKGSGYPITKPKLKPVFLFAILFAGFAVTFLPQAIANTNEERAFNFSYFTFLMSVMITVVYAGYYYNLSRYLLLSKLKKNHIRLSFFLLLTLLVVFPKNNILQAYTDVFSGQPQCYFTELAERHSYLSKHQGTKLVYVKPLTCKPKTLFFVDAMPNVKTWKNDGYEIYFKIDTVLALNPVQ